MNNTDGLFNVGLGVNFIDENMIWLRVSGLQLKMWLEYALMIIKANILLMCQIK